jgi:hypothetical protein
VDLGGSPISPVIFGRPPRGRDRHLQKSRKPARCRPTTVSELTMTRTSAHRDHPRRRVVQKSRSKEFSVGRGRLRLSTATWCRSAPRSARMNSTMNTWL